MKLYSGPLSMFGAKVQIALAEKGIAYDLEMVPFDMQRLYEPKHPEVVRINPKRQVPVLVDGDVELFDSTQIFEYLEDRVPRPALWPVDLRMRAAARQLELLADEVYFAPIIRLMGLQDRPEDPAAVAARAAASSVCAAMEARIAGREFLAGEFSYADIAFYMAQLFGERMGATLTAATPRLLDWRRCLSGRPSVRHVVLPMLDFLAAQGRPAPAAIAEPLRSYARPRG